MRSFNYIELQVINVLNKLLLSSDLQHELTERKYLLLEKNCNTVNTCDRIKERITSKPTPLHKRLNLRYRIELYDSLSCSVIV